MVAIYRCRLLNKQRRRHYLALDRTNCLPKYLSLYRRYLASEFLIQHRRISGSNIFSAVRLGSDAISEHRDPRARKVSREPQR